MRFNISVSVGEKVLRSPLKPLDTVYDFEPSLLSCSLYWQASCQAIRSGIESSFIRSCYSPIAVLIVGHISLAQYS